MSKESAATGAAVNHVRCRPMATAFPAAAIVMSLTLLGPLGAAPLCGQEPTPAPRPAPAEVPPDLAALLARLDAAHHPEGPVPEVRSFRAALEVHLIDASAEQGGQISLAFQYLRWQRSERSVRHLIRYEVKHSGEPIERGRDQYGMWHRTNGEAKPITEADTEDVAAVERHTQLARQLVSFLDPAAVLRTMTDPSPVRDEMFRRGREAAVECRTVEGTLSGFPLLRQQGDDVPVRIKVYVTAADGRLLAVLVRPLVDGKPDEARAELIRLLDYGQNNGMLVPNLVEHFYRTDDDKLAAQSRVVIRKLELNPPLTVDSFARK